MAVNLKPVDVAVVGLGAAGGVAVLPLCRAGLKGGRASKPEPGWTRTRISRPTRSTTTLAGMVTTGNKIRREAPTIRNSPTGPGPARRSQPDDERHRRHIDPLSRAELAPEAVGFQDRQRNHQALRQELSSARLDGGGLAHRLRRSGAVLRHRWSTRSASPAKPATSKARIDKEGNIFEGPRQREYPMPHLRSLRLSGA